MRLTKRGKLKRQKSLIILGTFSMLLFFSIGYAAFSTTIRLNAKGNVHPPVIYTVDDLKATALTGGTEDGLYEDNSEGIKRYIYKGTNDVKNYIKLKENNTDVLYRIYSLEDDGTVKVVRNEAVTSMSFDVDDETRRNGGYCTGSFCNAWAAMTGFINGSLTGDVVGLNGNSGDSSAKEYIDGTFSNTLDDYNKIVTKTWNISGTGYNNDSLSNTIIDEKKSTWNGKIALLTASEYVRGNSNTTLCGTLKLFRSNSSTCQTTNYLITSSAWWLLTPINSSISGLTTFSNGLVNYQLSKVEYGIRPSFYLCSGLTYKGDGTSTKPYEIAGGSCIPQQQNGS